MKFGFGLTGTEFRPKAEFRPKISVPFALYESHYNTEAGYEYGKYGVLGMVIIKVEMVTKRARMNIWILEYL